MPILSARSPNVLSAQRGPPPRRLVLLTLASLLFQENSSERPKSASWAIARLFVHGRMASPVALILPTFLFSLTPPLECTT
eukprot:7667677-Alexandrium_andersonii.AAC.1